MICTLMYQLKLINAAIDNAKPGFRLHDKAVELLDLLQQNLPDKTGEKRKWN